MKKVLLMMMVLVAGFATSVSAQAYTSSLSMGLYYSTGIVPVQASIIYSSNTNQGNSKNLTFSSEGVSSHQDITSSLIPGSSLKTYKINEVTFSCSQGSVTFLESDIPTVVWSWTEKRLSGSLFTVQLQRLEGGAFQVMIF